MDDNTPFPDPRIQGVREQHFRARWFFDMALKTEHPSARFRVVIASLYFTRAIVELMLEAAQMQQLEGFQNKDGQQSRKDFEKTLVPVLPHYHLIEKIRIHDFHRFGLIPPDPKRREIFYGGPTTLRPSQGAAVLSVPKEGPKITLTGQSTAEERRPLCTRDGRFFDDKGGTYLPLEKILADFLNAVPEVITKFEGLAVG